MPALIVLGCIVLLFVILFSVRINLRIVMKDDTALSLRILGIPIWLFPKKEKKYNPKDYTLKKIRKRDAKAAEKAAKAAEKKRKRKEERAKKKAEEAAELEKLTKEERKAYKEQKRPPVTEMVSLALKVTKLFSSRFFGKLHVRVIRLHVRIGANDAMTAAVIYGLANQTVQYTMEFLRKFCRVDKYSSSDIRIEPDFLIENIALDLDLRLRVTLGGILGALLKAGWKLLVGYMKIKPDPKHPRPSQNPPKAPTPPGVPSPDAPASLG